MRHLLLVLMAMAAAAGAQAADLTGFPFTDEDLTYSVNWPSGLGLGEIHTHAHKSEGVWKLEMTVDAGIPGFLVKDQYTSALNASFCSTDFTREASHGAHKLHENEAIQPPFATRTTMFGGGETRIEVPECVKDALGLLYYARRELGQGRVPPAQGFLFGNLYQMKFEYGGEQTIKVGDQQSVSDKVLCTVKTPASEIKFEVYFARDAARTPLVVRVPFAMATFSMELVR